MQWMLLTQLHTGLRAARVRRSQLRRHMAGEILANQALLRLARLCGLSLVTIYGVSAAVGDIERFAHSKKLVAYLGLNPSVCQSGIDGWRGRSGPGLRGKSRLKSSKPRPRCGTSRRFP